MTAQIWNDWKVGDRVRLRVWTPYAHPGTQGTVRSLYPRGERLEVQFDRVERTRLVPAADVERIVEPGLREG